MTELLKVHDLIEKLQEIEKEHGNIPVVIPYEYVENAYDWENLLSCDILVWESNVTEDGRVISDFELNTEGSKKLPVVHIG